MKAILILLPLCFSSGCLYQHWRSVKPCDSIIDYADTTAVWYYAKSSFCPPVICWPVVGVVIVDSDGDWKYDCYFSVQTDFWGRPHVVRRNRKLFDARSVYEERAFELGRSGKAHGIRGLEAFYPEITMSNSPWGTGHIISILSSHEFLACTSKNVSVQEKIIDVPFKPFSVELYKKIFLRSEHIAEVFFGEYPTGRIIFNYGRERSISCIELYQVTSKGMTMNAIVEDVNSDGCLDTLRYFNSNQVADEVSIMFLPDEVHLRLPDEDVLRDMFVKQYGPWAIKEFFELPFECCEARSKALGE